MWKLEAGERISRWRDFRKTLDSLNFEQALESTVDFWRSCPYHAFYLDVTAPENWPNPWDLIADNYYCDLAKTLGMLYTICLTKHGDNLEAEIRVYNDPETRYTYNLAVFGQGKYVVNYSDNKIVNISSIETKLVLQHRYDLSDIKIEQF